MEQNNENQKAVATEEGTAQTTAEKDEIVENPVEMPEDPCAGKTSVEEMETPTALTSVKTKKRRKRLKIVLLAILLFVVAVLGFLQIGVWHAQYSWEHWSPDYEKIDIRPILEKTELTEEDYETLYYQTGLTRLAIDDMRSEAGTQRILQIQDFFFKRQKVTSRRFNPFTYIEEIDGMAPMAFLRDGDIIVSATTRVSWLRYGHAALIVDGAGGVVVESIGPGVKSEFNSIDTFANLANFLIVRPKMDEETKKELVAYAKEYLTGIPYRFTIGFFYEKYNAERIKHSQCAHLVWYAYKRFGLDLDSNGGMIVKPQDMILSEHVEVVQAYGFDLDSPWDKKM